MSLTQQDKIEIDQRAGRIVERVLTRHVETCPHHQSYLISRARVVGVMIGVILASGATSGTVATLILKFLH